MLALEGSDAVTWARVAVTSDESADGHPSGYTWNARGPVGDVLFIDASTSRVWLKCVDCGMDWG